MVTRVLSLPYSASRNDHRRRSSVYSVGPRQSPPRTLWLHDIGRGASWGIEEEYPRKGRQRRTGRDYPRSAGEFPLHMEPTARLVPGADRRPCRQRRRRAAVGPASASRAVSPSLRCGASTSQEAGGHSLGLRLARPLRCLRRPGPRSRRTNVAPLRPADYCPLDDGVGHSHQQHVMPRTARRCDGRTRARRRPTCTEQSAETSMESP